MYMSESIWSLRQSVAYTKKQLIQALAAVLLCNILFSFFLARWIAKPLGQIQKATEKMANRDYTVRLPKKYPKNEIGQMSNNINCIAETIQYNLADLQNYNYLLLSQNQNLEEFEQMRKKFIGNMTHQLKTPLAIISSQTELFFNEKDEKRKEYYMNSIMEEIDKMSLLISNILQNSKLEHEIMNVRLRWANLSELLSELVPKYENLLSSNQIELSSSIEENCVAYIDPLQMHMTLKFHLRKWNRRTSTLCRRFMN